MTNNIRSCLGLILLALLGMPLGLAHAQSDSTTASTTGAPTNSGSSANPSKDTPNVVLGRELIQVTKQIEELISIQQEALRVRSHIVSPESRNTEYASLQSTHAALKQEVTASSEQIKKWQDELDDIVAQFMKTGNSPPNEAPPPAQKEGNAGNPSARHFLLAEGIDFQFVSLNDDETSRQAAADPPSGSRAVTLHLLLGRAAGILRATDRYANNVRVLTNRVQRLKTSLGNVERRWESQEWYDYSTKSLLEALIRRSTIVEVGVSDQDGSFLRERREQLSMREPPIELVDSPWNERSPQPLFNQPSEAPALDETARLEQEIGTKLGQARLSVEAVAARLDVIASDLTSCDDSLKSLGEQAKKFTLAAKEFETKVGEVVRNVQERLKVTQARKSAIEAALSDRDSGLNQFQINQYLVYAVYGMVISIVALFVLLRWYPDSLTELIVEQRVFVEILSMGFLLLTVIILGSGKLITGEGLAGLLGTIAGYIFAKKTSDLFNNNRDSESPNSVERNLARAHVELASLQSQLVQAKQLAEAEPSTKATEALGKIELQIAATRSRIDALSEALGSMAQARSSARPEGSSNP